MQTQHINSQQIACDLIKVVLRSIKGSSPPCLLFIVPFIITIAYKCQSRALPIDPVGNSGHTHKNIIISSGLRLKGESWAEFP